MDPAKFQQVTHIKGWLVKAAKNRLHEENDDSFPQRTTLRKSQKWRHACGNSIS